jgi:hypothetical protein
MPHSGDDLAGSLGLLCIWGANLGEAFGEDSPLATVVPATPATQTQPEDHLRALDRKVDKQVQIRDALTEPLLIGFHQTKCGSHSFIDRDRQELTWRVA